MSLRDTHSEFLGIMAKEKRSSPGSFWPALLKFWKDPGGTVAITGGLSITVLFGFTALAVDVASWQVAKRSMQGAADAAAYSAGVASIKNNGSGITTQAKGIAAANGYVDARMA
jgi:Flp pilus assembly protein TadG